MRQSEAVIDACHQSEPHRFQAKPLRAALPQQPAFLTCWVCIFTYSEFQQARGIHSTAEEKRLPEVQQILNRMLGRVSSMSALV